MVTRCRACVDGPAMMESRVEGVDMTYGRHPRLEARRGLVGPGPGDW